MFSISEALSRSLIEYAYLGTLLLAFTSFWYGSLKYFKQDVETIQSHRLILRILTVIAWNLSYYSVLSAKSAGSPQIFIGFVVNIGAILIFWMTLSQLKKSRLAVIFDTSKPDFLNSSGMYRFIRHPFYTSYVLVYMSVIFTQTFLFLQGLCFLLIVYYYFAATTEEKNFLRSDLASQYALYRSKTGMFLPKVFKKLK